MRGELLVRGLLRGVLAMVVGVTVFTSPVSAAVPTSSGGETVITAHVMPVRHIVVDHEGVIQRIISNTSENVTPIVHLGTAEGEEILLTTDVKQRYESVIAHLDMQRPADYVRKQPLEILLTRLQNISTLPLRAISQAQLTKSF